jgi:hypothetical protein
MQRNAALERQAVAEKSKMRGELWGFVAVRLCASAGQTSARSAETHHGRTTSQSRQSQRHFGIAMDRLPAELVSTIAEYLRESSLGLEPFADLTETSQLGPINWLTYTTSSLRDVCNFRLVCRTWYNNSAPTFGAILSNRIFRITKVGLEDLQAISEVAALQPHIKSLTFGNAQFDDPALNSALRELLSWISEPDQTRLRDAYTEAYQWQLSQGQAAWHLGMTAILYRFTNVKSLRLLCSDWPEKEHHLGGWLSPQDGETMAQVYADVFVPSMEYVYTRRREFGDVNMLAPVFDAIKDTKTNIQDLRIGVGDPPTPTALLKILHTAGINESLRHLRLDIYPHSLGSENQCALWRKFFEPLINLTSLSVSLAWKFLSEHYSQETSNLLDILKSVPLLEKLTIQGVWCYKEDDLVDLVTAHSSTLTHLVLNGPVLQSDDWASVTRRLLQARPCSMQHLRFSDMKLNRARARIVPAFDSSGWQELMTAIQGSIEGQTTCSVYLSSGEAEYIYRPLEH